MTYPSEGFQLSQSTKAQLLVQGVLEMGVEQGWLDGCSLCFSSPVLAGARSTSDTM